MLNQRYCMKNVMWTIMMFVMTEAWAQTQPVKIQIAVTSDVHGTIFPYDFINKKEQAGSLSQVSAYANRMRRNGDTAFVLLDNGDILQGQPVMDYYNQVKTEPTHICAQVMNYIGFDAATVGNHDIECGHGVYDKLRTQFKFPWMAANAIDTATGKSFFEPYTIIERKGVRIAIIGLTTPGIPQWLPRELWSGLRFDDMVEAASLLVNEIKVKHNPRVIIGLFHAGLDATYGGQKSGERFNQNPALLIAQHVPGFDVVISGHDHKPTSYNITNDFGKSVTVINPGSHSRYLGVVNMVVDKSTITGTGQLLDLKQLPADPAFDSAFAPQIDEVKNYLSQRIGAFAQPFNINEALFGDCDFVDLIHQVQLKYSGADISFAEPMALNVKVDSGDVCLNDLFKLYKFSNTLYTLRLTGDEVDKFLEFACGQWFNQMTMGEDHLLRMNNDNRMDANVYNLSSAEGIRYNVDVSRVAGDRVTITGFTNGKPFDAGTTYKVALSSYRANGGGHHLTTGVGLLPDELPSRVVSVSEQDYRFLLMQYIQAQGTIYPIKNNNWHIEPQAWVEGARVRDGKAMRLKN